MIETERFSPDCIYSCRN